jgi:glucosamine-6-phosphate deaminase
MKIRRFASADDVAMAVAARMDEVVRRTPHAVLGLPAGRTMEPVYGLIRSRAHAAASEWAGVRTFQVDEFIGVAPADPGTFRSFLQRHLLGGLGLHTRQVNFLDGQATDIEAECARYERAIADAGGIDLQLLGIGRNGHIAFNEPAETLTAGTHAVTLHADTRRANAVWFGGEEARVPHQALTMGMATLLGAREVLLVATGESKAEAVAGAVRGPLTTWLPASFLQLHGVVELFLDAGAASALRLPD